MSIHLKHFSGGFKQVKAVTQFILHLVNFEN